MTEPVCRSPWISASPCVMKAYFARPIASTKTSSAASAAASGSFSGRTTLRPASTDGSVNTRSSVISHSSGLIAAACASASSCRAEPEDRGAEGDRADVPPHGCGRAVVGGAVVERVRHTWWSDRSSMPMMWRSSSWCSTSTTSSGTRAWCASSELDLVLSRSGVIGQPSPTIRTYGRACLTTTPRPSASLARKTRLRLPSPISPRTRAGRRRSARPAPGPTRGSSAPLHGEELVVGLHQQLLLETVGRGVRSQVCSAASCARDVNENSRATITTRPLAVSWW